MCRIDGQCDAAAWTAGTQRRALCQPRRVGGGEVQEGGDICVLVVDSCFCIKEINTML